MARAFPKPSTRRSSSASTDAATRAVVPVWAWPSLVRSVERIRHGSACTRRCRMVCGCVLSFRPQRASHSGSYTGSAQGLGSLPVKRQASLFGCLRAAEQDECMTHGLYLPQANDLNVEAFAIPGAVLLLQHAHGRFHGGGEIFIGLHVDLRVQTELGESRHGAPVQLGVGVLAAQIALQGGDLDDVDVVDLSRVAGEAQVLAGHDGDGLGEFPGAQDLVADEA